MLSQLVISLQFQPLNSQNLYTECEYFFYVQKLRRGVSRLTLLTKVSQAMKVFDVKEDLKN